MHTLLTLLQWLLGVGAALWLLVVAGMALFQSRLVYHPSATVTATPSDIGLAYEPLWIDSAHQETTQRIRAWFVPASGPGTSASPMPAPEGNLARGTVLFCHGNAGNLGHRLETIQILHRLGLNVLAFDYQGYGESSGHPGEEQTRTDALACWDWLVAERGISPKRIILMGRSLGGGVAARLAADLAAQGRQPAALVLESTFTSLPDVGARLYPWLPVRLLARHTYGTLELLPSLARVGLPLLVIHSPEDELVPFDLGQSLYATYQGPKDFLTIQGSHNQGYLLTGPAYDQGLDAFVSRTLTSERNDS